MTVQSERRIRVWVEDVWESVTLDVTDDWTVARLKEAALRQATDSAARADGYSVKFRGALILDEQATLSQLGVPDNAALIVLAARRRPVR